ncbi:hypothetical protein [Streptomyces boluensis]|uniref:Uncharacterized protein n=1 Tax=Streptomyces boluensis TaxID=1775135 RepID=A0A964UXT8_9ACTN|nr:hypothetical protein [Streptomyces boluensis]NBE56697.1 hypothetical protein [Streptomyces boluensis]
MRALNERDAAALIEAGGVPSDRRARREAQEIIEERGGKGLRVQEVRVEHDFGPDVGSAKLHARTREGGDVRETLTVTRESGEWHVSIFRNRPGDKPSSGTL